LEVLARKSMDVIIYKVVDDLPKLASLLTDAVELKVLCQKTDAHLKGLVELLSSDWSDSTFVENLSEEALHYLLVNTSSDPGTEDILLFKEYLRFRSVLHWWVYHSDLVRISKETLLSSLIPDKVGVLKICVQPGNPLEAVEVTEKALSRDWHILLTEDVP
jgi:hypothetical protein